MLLAWYPSGYFGLMGGGKLLATVVGCDLVLGPMLFLVAYDASKTRLARGVDAAILTAVRIAALVFGFSEVVDARPVFAVFAIDRFNIVAASEVNRADLAGYGGQAPYAMPWSGPARVDLRLPDDPQARNQVLELELTGIALHTLPRFFAPFAARPVLARSEPLAALAARHPVIAESAARMVARAGLRDVDVVWLPVQTRFGFATALLNRHDASLVGFIDADPY